jgi:hypothetical protein
METIMETIQDVWDIFIAVYAGVNKRGMEERSEEMWRAFGTWSNMIQGAQIAAAETPPDWRASWE